MEKEIGEKMKKNSNNNMIFDFHIHSKFSYDSLLSPKKIMRVAENKGLYGIAITDHSTIRGSLEAKKVKSKVKVIVGSEIKTEIGEVIGLFLNEEIRSDRFDEVIDEIKDQDGIVVLPHPFKKKEMVTEDVLDRVDIIETLNGRVAPELNYKAQILAEQKNLCIIGGSDAHTAGRVGSVKTIFNSNRESICNVEDIRKVLLRGDVRVIGTESPRYVHYLSAIVGNIRDGTFSQLCKSAVKEMHSIFKRGF